MALPALPLTPNAKVDRAALPAPKWGARPAGAGRVEPRTPVEETLARIWGELLATPTAVGVTDNLFAIGGHSLTATRFVARVADSYGVSLPVHEIFAHPTIGELAEIVSKDPGFGRADSAGELDELSDEALDELLRAALAQRNRRRAAPEETRHVHRHFQPTYVRRAVYSPSRAYCNRSVSNASRRAVDEPSRTRSSG